MKTIHTTISIILCVMIWYSFAPVLLAQDNEFENYSFDDDKATSTKLPYFALSFGGNASALFMKYDDINKKPINHEIGSWKELFADGSMDFSGPLFGWGINLFSALSPLVNNTRLGFSYQTVSQSHETTKTEIMNNKNISVETNYYRNLSVSITGVHFDYAFVPFKSLAILPGIGLKFGTMTLEQYQTTDIVSTWQLTSYEDLIAFRNENLKYSFASIEPQLNIEYAITGFLMFRVCGSYALPFDNPLVKNVWKVNGNSVYADVPKGVAPTGFQLAIGLYLGLFNY